MSGISSNHRSLQVHKWSDQAKEELKALSALRRFIYIIPCADSRKGKGVFCSRDLQPGEDACLFEGDRLKEEEINNRELNGKCTAYVVRLSGGVHVDAFGYNRGAGYSNHSCRPNAILETRVLGGDNDFQVVVLRVLKYVPAWREITYSYQLRNHLEVFEVFFVDQVSVME